MHHQRRVDFVDMFFTEYEVVVLDSGDGGGRRVDSSCCKQYIGGKINNNYIPTGVGRFLGIIGRHIATDTDRKREDEFPLKFNQRSEN